MSWTVDLKNRVSSLFYRNMLLLGSCYPHSLELKMCLKEDMFNESNKSKSSFEQVLYYLLNIITKKKCKDIRWPVLCVQDSIDFRNKAKNIVSEIIKEYPDSGIPAVSTYILMSYGGMKVLNFMYRLSYFALKMHAQRNYGVNLGLVKKLQEPTNETKTITEDLKHNCRKSYLKKCRAYEYLAKSSSTLIRDKEEEENNIDGQLEEKKLELSKLISSCPGNYISGLLDPAHRNDTIIAMHKEAGRLAADNRNDCANISTLKRSLSHCYLLTSENGSEDSATCSSATIDQARFESLLKTEAVSAYAQNMDIDLYSDGKLSFDNFLELGNSIIKNWPHLVSDTASAESSIAALKAIGTLHAESADIPKRITSLTESLIDSCRTLDSDLGHARSDEEEIKFPGLTESPPVLLAHHSDTGQLVNYYASPGEGSGILSNIIERFRGRAIVKSTTPNRRTGQSGKWLHCHAQSEFNCSRGARYALSPYGDSPTGVIRPADRRLTVGSPQPALIRSVFQRRQHTFKRNRNRHQPKTSPVTTSSPRHGCKKKGNQTPGHRTFTCGDKQNEETFQELFCSDFAEEDEEAFPTLETEFRDWDIETAKSFNNHSIQSIIDRYNKIKQRQQQSEYKSE